MNKIQTHLLTVTFFSIPIIATLKGKGTFILALALFLIFGLKHIGQAKNLYEKIKGFKYRSISFWAILFSFWTLASCFWTPLELKSLGHFLKYSGLILTAYITFQAFKKFDKNSVQKYSKIYITAFLMFLFYMAFEVLGPHWVSTFYTKSEGFNKRLYINAIVILVFLFWPAVLFIKAKYPKKFKKIHFAGVFIFLIFLLSKTEPNAAMLAFFLSSFAYLSAQFSKNWIRITKYMIVILSISLPVLFSQTHFLSKYHDKILYLATSYQHRLHIWNGMVTKNDTIQKKLIGNGFDYSTTIKGGKEICFRHLKPKFKYPFSVQFKLDPPCKEPSAIFSSHPHNGLIQIYVELGIIGVLIFLTLLWKIFGFIENQKDKVLRSIYFATLISYLTIFFISFGLWQTWLAGLMILTVHSLLVASKYYNRTP